MMRLKPLDTRDVYPSRRPRLVDGQSILHLDVPSRPTTKTLAANVAGPEAHRATETRRWDDEHVYRRHAVGMIAKERLPALRRGRRLFAMYFATVVWPTSIPSLSSSP
jgi:hypothetical protein